ncbi:hypothetical protein PTT_13556 [Pyrenophora teres f. teres 0-1]|uniref:Uncharacterized protein n=1 Tax=Pyrenophora teres f. teres (strain 0-1) TaxID=861557 RepID=E3RWB8_PYRTT|nr:hypothetical protein PTT_13556 [Pyrenophora teres f. teres 0-1]KAE8839093.1 hypothetical protein HRS9139_03476 [Pyrenophora teres f. teres]KAE8845059.1 hypothetical protein PTNB85_03324 [Pyrenophora teres f. teres]
MDISASPKSKGVSKEEKIPIVWSHDVLTERARAEIPDYRLATASNDIAFAGPFGDAQIPNRKQTIPAEAPEMMLIVGSYMLKDQETSPETTVYAFVYGEKGNQIGFMYMYEQGKAARLDAYRCKEIKYREPFCYLSNDGLGQQSIRLVLRAFLLFQFLHAGCINEVANYNSFWVDFAKACSWIANKGRRAETGLFRPKTQTACSETSASATAVGTKPMLHPRFATKAQVEASSTRELEENGEDEESVQPRIKRRDYSTGSNITVSAAPPSHITKNPQGIPISSPTPKKPSPAHGIGAARETPNSEPQKEIARLKNDVDAMRQRGDLVHNAYSGLKRNYDQLSIAHSKVVKEVQQLQARYLESSESGKRWKTQAEEAEKREEALKTQHREDRAAMAEARLLLETPD